MCGHYRYTFQLCYNMIGYVFSASNYINSPSFHSFHYIRAQNIYQQGMFLWKHYMNRYGFWPLNKWGKFKFLPAYPRHKIFEVAPPPPPPPQEKLWISLFKHLAEEKTSSNRHNIITSKWFLAHLSRRHIRWAYRIGSWASVCASIHPSVLSVHPHFQT